MNQYIFKYQTIFSAKFYQQNEDNQVLDEREIFINLNIIHNLTQTVDIDNILIVIDNIDNTDVKSALKHQIQQQERKDSGWRFDKNNSRII